MSDNVVYKIHGILKIVGATDCETGDFGKEQGSYIDVSFSGKTPLEVIKDAGDFIGACFEVFTPQEEDIGRIDADRIENAEGDEPTPEELQKWRRGELVLYSAYYTAYVEVVSRATLPED